MQKSLEKKVLHLRAQHPGNIHTREHLFRSQKEHQTMYTFGTSLKKKKKAVYQEHTLWTSLVVLWIGICLPMQGSRVSSLG